MADGRDGGARGQCAVFCGDGGSVGGVCEGVSGSEVSSGLRKISNIGKGGKLMDTPMGNEVVERVKANPTPQGKTWRCRVARFMAWGRARRLIVNFRALDRAAAMDSVRNVLAVIGVGTVLADFG